MRVYRGFVIWSSESWQLAQREKKEPSIHGAAWSSEHCALLHVSGCLSNQVQPGSGSSEPSTEWSLLWCCVGVGAKPTLTALFASTVERKSWLASKLYTHWKDRWRERNGILQMSFSGAKTKLWMATLLKETLKISWVFLHTSVTCCFQSLPAAGSCIQWSPHQAGSLHQVMLLEGSGKQPHLLLFSFCHL